MKIIIGLFILVITAFIVCACILAKRSDVK